MEVHTRPLYLVAEVSGSFKFTVPPAGTGPGPVPTAAVSGSADVSSNDYLSNLQFAGMLSFEAAKGRWSILSDILYVDFSDSNRDVTIPGLGAGAGVQISADTGLQAMIFEIAGAYSVYKGEQGNFDVLLGMRYAGIEGKIDLNAIGPDGRTYFPRIKESLNFYDPIVGFKGKFLFTKNWFMPYYFDIGGFSVDSDLTMQAYAAIGYRSQTGSQCPSAIVTCTMISGALNSWKISVFTAVYLVLYSTSRRSLLW